MSKPIIEVEHLSKCYRIGAMREPYLSLREELAKKTRRISSAFSRAFRNGQTGPSGSETDFWALNDVSFSVQEGEAVGIIGRNGAGKSTLLKILSQITPPTKGQITMRGRVASLLEVGTGFHPELTGRENIFLNGAILGMTRAEIRKKFDEIVAFSEVEKFLDTPVKRYSSGMYVRLAFAVAAHLEPEILIVDEVLAVGDAMFQKKCLGKMKEVGKEGRTVLFVSHNMGVIESLCKCCFLLDKGILVESGTASIVVKIYEALSLQQKNKHQYPEGVLFLEKAIVLDSYKITEVRIKNTNDAVIRKIKTFDDFVIEITFFSPRIQKNGSIALYIKQLNGSTILRLASMPDSGYEMDFKQGENKVKCIISGLPLPAGNYVIDVGLAIPMREWLCFEKEICTIEVGAKDIHGSGFPPIDQHAFAVTKYQWEFMDSPS
jgi:lipopolysaccharide transport system ATP-binding protein